MKCPFCKSELIEGEKKYYTNTSEHAFDPNGEFKRPLRKTYVCPSGCHLSQGSFWDSQGGWYGGTIDYREISNWKISHRKDFDSDATAAIGSWDEWISNKNLFSRKVYKLLFWMKGNDRYFAASNLTKLVFKYSEPKFEQ